MCNDLYGSKLEIFDAAATLFSRHGYHAVSMRQIANRVDLTVGSLYYYFKSKEEILTTIYRYFDENMKSFSPNLEEMMEKTEYEDPHAILRMGLMIFPEDIKRLMAKSMLVTATLAHSDSRAEEIIEKNFIEMPAKYDRPVLERLIALDRIEPLDINSFILIHTNFCYSSAVRFYVNSEKAISSDDYVKGLEMIYRIVKVKS